MKVHRLAASVIVRAPAKLNLFFEILGKRDDGFHEIETLMVPVSLFDTLVASPRADERITLDCRWVPGLSAAHAAMGDLPPSEANLATRAVELLRKRAGARAGLALELSKRIPSAAGLGGASSDAAAALLAANEIWQLGWTREALAELAAELGSDVPFFLGSGPAICRGRGEIIEPVAGLAALDCVVVRPPEGLPTGKVYAAAEVPKRPQRWEPLVEQLRDGDLRGLNHFIHNRLERAAAALSPWIGMLEREMASQDCVAAQMSGSGSAYFGICRHARHAERVARRLQARGIGQVYAARSSN